MNKKLEIEYRNLMSEDVPDLWDRIDAGLKPKEPAVTGRKAWRKYSVWTVAAACLCLIICMPGLLREMGSKNSSEGAAENFAAGENCGEASYSGTENAADTEMSVGRKDAADTGELEGMEPTMDMEQASGTEHAQISNGIDVDGVASEATPGIPSETVTGFTIKAKVLENVTENGVMAYLVQIEETDCTDFVPDGEVKLYAEEGMKDELLQGESYILDIIPSSEEGMTVYLIHDVSY